MYSLWLYLFEYNTTIKYCKLHIPDVNLIFV